MNAPVAATEDLLYSVEDGIARLTFNRPQARNALTFAMYEQMAAICETVNADRSIKAMILTGAGDKAFASGTDISQFRAFKTAQDALDYEARIDRVLGALEAVPGADDCGHCRRLHRRRRRDRRLLRHPDRHRGDADRLSDRAHARQLPVDVQYQPAGFADRAGADQGSDLQGAAGRSARGAGARPAQRSGARRRDPAAPRR